MTVNERNEGLIKLKEAFKEINRWEYENLHIDDMEEVIPSPRYLRRMRRLIRRQKRSSWHLTHTIGQRAAGIAIAITILFTCSMTVSAMREPILEFFTNVYERFVEIFFHEDDVAEAPSTIETVYTLGVVPDGYVMDECMISDIAVRITWRNENGDRLVLSQTVLHIRSTLDAEESEYDIIERNEKKYVYAEKHGIKYFFWNSHEYKFSLSITNEMPHEGVAKLIESLIPYNE